MSLDSPSAQPPPLEASALARYLAFAYAVLVIYASLHPLSGWTSVGVDPFAFLTAPLPRYILRFDVLANLLGYMPLGFLAALALHPELNRGRAVLAATLMGTALSFVLETLQNYLPVRTPSNLDLATNILGALAGALIAARVAPLLLLQGGLKAERYRLFRAGKGADAGLVLLALWLFTQLDPQSLLFGAGDLRPFFEQTTIGLHAAQVFIRAEALVAGSNALAVGLLVGLLAAPAGRTRSVIALIVGLALAVHAAAYALFFGSEDAFNWLTPGAYLGAGAGFLIVLGAVSLPRPVQLALCAIAIMVGAVVVNIAPPNPYLVESLSNWQQGYFFHLVGLARLASAAWPFLALAYVVALATER